MTTGGRSVRTAATLLLSLGALAAAAQDKVVSEITTRLDAAVSASSTQHASSLIREAEAIFQSPRARNMSELSRQFLRAELGRTHGRVAAMSWQRLEPGDPRRATYRDEARRWLAKAMSGLQDLRHRAERARREHEERLDKRKQDYKSDGLWREAAYYERLACHNAAWTEYTTAKLAGPASRDSHLRKAIELFMTFGDHLFDPFNANAAFGRGMCLLELKAYGQLITFLKDTLADHHELEGALRRRERGTSYKRLVHLLLRAYEARRDRDKLEESAERYFSELTPSHRDDGLDEAMRALRKRNLAAMGRSAPEAPAGQTKAPARDTARSTLEAARRHFGNRQYRQAAAVAEQGLRTLARLPAIVRAQPTRDGRATSVGSDLRYIRAAAYWNIGRWLEAYNSAYEFLRHHPSDTRVASRDVSGREEPGMCRIAFEAALRARKGKPGLSTSDFVAFLDYIENRFPDEEGAKKAPYYRGLAYVGDSQHTKAIRVFRDIPRTSPFYRRARYALGLSAYRLVEAEPRWLKLAVHDVTQCLGALAGDPSTWQEPDRPLAQSGAKLAVATARRLLALRPPGHRDALALIDRAAALQGVGDGIDEELLALRVACNAVAGKTGEAAKLVESLGDGDATDHVARAFASVADHLEQAHDRLAEAGRRTEASQMANILVGVYSTVLRHRDGHQDAAMRKVQLSCRRRLARSLLRLGRHREAIPHYEWLLGRDLPEDEKAPRVPRSTSGDLFRGLALAYEGLARESQSSRERAEAYEAAIATWRELARGTRTATDEWLEARYHLIRAYLLNGQPQRAGDLLRYLRAQCPRLKAEEWKTRFHELEVQLSRDGQ